MSCSLSAEAEINIRYPSLARNPTYVSFGEIFHIFSPMHIKAGSLAYVGYNRSFHALRRRSRTIVELSMYVYRYCKCSAMSGDGTKRVGSYNLLPPLTPRSRAAERRSLHYSSEDGPRNLFI